MTDHIDRDLFNHLVELAALELKEDEAEYLRLQLNKQLNVIQELAAIPLDNDLPVTSHGVPFTPDISQVLREDEWLPFENVEKIKAQVPQIDDGSIVVPDIPHTTLE